MKKDENLPISYEASIRYLVEKSNKRAWTIAFISIVIAILSIIAVMLLTPLKSVEPYVIRVDSAGMVDIITSVDEEFLDTDEALDKYFTTQYVKAREGYYYNFLTNDYMLVQILSAPNVANEYRQIYEGKNARQDQLRNNTEVSIDIVSVVLGESAGAKMATIRFNENHKNTQNNNVVATFAKIATISYDYSPQDLISEEQRLQNPLGFKVLTYRVDAEIRR